MQSCQEKGLSVEETIKKQREFMEGAVEELRRTGGYNATVAVIEGLMKGYTQ